MLSLTYVLPSHDRSRFESLPDLRLRAYHDARLLEAEASSQPKRNEHNTRGRLIRPGERELQQRWMRNMMLNKWLEYCAERGHRFTPAERP